MTLRLQIIAPESSRSRDVLRLRTLVAVNQQDDDHVAVPCQSRSGSPDRTSLELPRRPRTFVIPSRVVFVRPPGAVMTNSQIATSGCLTDEPVAEIVQCGEPTSMIGNKSVASGQVDGGDPIGPATSRRCSSHARGG